MVKENLKELFEVLKKKHVSVGEAAIVIVRTMSEKYSLPNHWCGPINEPGPTPWEALPDFALEELKEWFINNWYRVFSILEPIRHEQIMALPGPQAQQYRDWFNSAGEKGRAMMSGHVDIKWYNKD